MRYVSFSYAIVKDDVVIPSRHQYRFASLHDFHRSHVSVDDFYDPLFIKENDQTIATSNAAVVQGAYHAINNDSRRTIVPFFTRGDTLHTDHPIHEIHRAIDRVISLKLEDPSGSHHIYLTMYDFDNGNVTSCVCKGERG